MMKSEPGTPPAPAPPQPDVVASKRAGVSVPQEWWLGTVKYILHYLWSACVRRRVVASQGLLPTRRHEQVHRVRGLSIDVSRNLQGGPPKGSPVRSMRTTCYSTLPLDCAATERPAKELVITEADLEWARRNAHANELSAPDHRPDLIDLVGEHLKRPARAV